MIKRNPQFLTALTAFKTRVGVISAHGSFYQDTKGN
jgi:hypothetical protein